MALNTSSILNISCPDTALVHKALDLAYAHSSPSIYNHLVRSFLFSCLIGPSLLPRYDAEVVAISTLLHDLGLDLSATSENSPDVVISQDKRFEVDSANAARACTQTFAFNRLQLYFARLFVEIKLTDSIKPAVLSREAPDWEPRKVQLVWDSCALHATASIARYKEPEVIAASMGIGADFAGPGEGPGRVSHKDWDAIVKEWPRDGLKRGLGRPFVNFADENPRRRMIIGWGSMARGI
jgi:hypothetical protein